jgi:cytoskeleton protein RodZ
METDQAEPNTTVSPGAMLRQERLAQGLDLARAGAQLHLSDNMIEALEADDFDSLPGPVFIQGYLRNYARLLGISEVLVLKAYQRIRPEVDAAGIQASGVSGVVPEVHSSNRFVQLVTWTIVVGLLALLVIWWQDRFHWQTEPVVDGQLGVEAEATLATEVRTSAPQEEAERPRIAAEKPQIDADKPQIAAEKPFEFVPPKPSPLIPSSSLSQSSEQNSGTSDSPVDELEPDLVAEPNVSMPTELNPNEPTEITNIESLLSNEPAIAPPPQIESPVAEQGLTPSPTSPVPTAANESGIQQVELPKVQLSSLANAQMVFEFTGPCWAEVRDSTGKAHIIGEMNAGDRRTVDADLGPFKVVLGNINFARLTIAGQPFDLTTQSNGVVARFTLDPTQL